MNSLDKLAITWGSRLPMIMQTEAAECGVACLAMIVGYHGQPCEITELRRRLSVSLKGTTLKHLVGMAERLGFAARPLRLELDELRQLSTPCILHWDLHHFVVLAKVTRDGIVIHDPAVGVRRLPMAAVSRHFTGVALELTPVGELAPAQESPRVRLRSILGRVVGLRARSDSCSPSPWRSRCSRSRARCSCSGWSTMRWSAPTAICCSCWRSASACCCCCERWSRPCAAGS
jgi:ATP-binding cassette subfamily B protein RaxB